ncbi:MAG TPA: hypothetical protein VF543_22345 [Pyrinomonadaceae bacterium]|jgi:hypothetical protein
MARGSETHKLILQFLVQGQAEKRISALTKQLRGANKEATSLQRALNKLKPNSSLPKSALPKSGATTTALNRETRAVREQVKLMQDRVRLEREQARLTQTKARATGAQRSAEIADIKLLRERARLEREAARATGRTGRRGRRASGDYDNVDRFNRGVQTARNIGYVAQRTYDMVRGGFIDPALELKRAQTNFQMLNYPQAEQARGLQAVQQVTSQIRGVRQVDVTELLTNLTGTMGSVNDAIALLPQASKFLAATEALNGDRVGRQEAIRAFSNAAKTVELMGKDIDTATAKQYLNLIAQSNLATGGEVNPSELRNFVKQGQIVGMQFSPEGIMKFMPLIQQMGGKNAGTALTSLYSSVVGGQIPAHKLKYWGEMGLLDRSKVEFNQQGKIARLLPGAIPIAEGMGRDPFIFTDKLMAAFDRKGVDTTNVEAVAKQLEVMFGNRTAKREVAQMMLMRRQLDKETQNYMRVPDIEGFYSSMFERGNPLGQFLEFTASQTNARAAAGAPVMSLGGNVAEQLSNQIKSLQAMSADNPTTAAALIGILSLGKASAEAADGVGIFNGMLRGGSGGGGINSEVAAGGASLIGRGAVGAAGLATNPVTFSIMAIAGGAFASYKNVQAYRQQLGVERGASAQLADITQRRERGESVDYAASARSVREALTRGGELSRAEGIFTVKEFENNLYRKLARPFYGNGPLPTDREMLQRFAPQLAIPDVRQSFIQTELPQLGLSSEGQQNIKRAIEAVFINSLPNTGIGNLKQLDEKRLQGMPEFAQSLLRITEPAKQTADAFGQCVDPANKIPPAFRNVSSAAQSLADRVNSIVIERPTFPAFPTPSNQTSSTPNVRPFGGYFAKGGRVLKGVDYIGGERGVELFTPNANGFVTPNDELQKFVVSTRALNADRKRSNQALTIPRNRPELNLPSTSSLRGRELLREVAYSEAAYVNQSSVPSGSFTAPQVNLNYSPNINATFTGSSKENAESVAKLRQLLDQSKDELFAEFESRMRYIEAKYDERS